ncbi:hypothetical protein [Niabella ginsengisoli]|uniref:MFS transporter n=1 Tax=Niabella ginsengisoli TaxID=522298 RepID=A0ABS9SJZ2_9BACT|nr:hypothetical protein [Niabella ginsengisoli]MCH5598655.1 hypothetical protein [Niabella ginsengisoli]
MIKQYKWTFRLCLLTPLLLIAAVFAMGAGHGTYIPAVGLFPFGMLGIIWQDKISLPFIIISILQYPVYGYIIDKVILTKQTKFAILGLLLIHIILAILIVKLSGENWH